LVAPTYVDIDYLTMKGKMRGVRGDTWTLRHDLPTVKWFAENDPQASCLNQLNRSLEVEVNRLTPSNPGDFYFWGGSVARKAQLATIAEHIGRQDLIAKVLQILKDSIEPWFDELEYL
jgi:endo-1,3(4)-beta-glucanase